MNQFVRYPTREASMYGTQMPMRFGYAWYRIHEDQEVWMVIPLNYIVSWLRRLQYTLRGGAGPIAIEQAFNKGYARGCQATGETVRQNALSAAERAWERASSGWDQTITIEGSKHYLFGRIPHTHEDVEYHEDCDGCEDPKGGIWPYDHKGFGANP